MSPIKSDDYVKDYTKSNIVDTFHIYNQIYGLSKRRKDNHDIDRKDMVVKKF
jgi:hypothetical protein